MFVSPRFKVAVAAWQSRPVGRQRCVVMRHAERADAEIGCDGRWDTSEEAMAWPFDPPTTDLGVASARDVAVDFRGGALPPSLLGRGGGSGLNEEHQKAWIHDGSAPSGAAVSQDAWMVVCSPHFRCVQTAVEVCQALGPEVSLMIDLSLGEVYGPEIMGDIQPSSPIRPASQTQAYCAARGVKLRCLGIGAWPTWPESLQQARGRLLKRFLQYLERSVVARRSFVLVTHADGVAAALAAMPSLDGRVIERVSYCGHFVAEGRFATHGPHPCDVREDTAQTLCGAEDFETAEPRMLRGQRLAGQLERCQGWTSFLTEFGRSLAALLEEHGLECAPHCRIIALLAEPSFGGQRPDSRWWISFVALVRGWGLLLPDGLFRVHLHLRGF